MHDDVSDIPERIEDGHRLVHSNEFFDPEDGDFPVDITLTIRSKAAWSQHLEEPGDLKVPLSVWENSTPDEIGVIVAFGDGSIFKVDMFKGDA